ncbi:hypothetical protein C7410_14739 [Paraburkholderia silvatlantica]|uniref:Uncharacterized protein n=1 Tax=Paraburkholderia silvatlantica TaxID=321895 RepID=A0A2V4T2N0_9BURK|nr:hypothetical protein [Paraburkholderia silvatlantica]PYE13384.1 hypothetical protein C7410_14739 [Paraburkholderia silvatlantica]
MAGNKKPRRKYNPNRFVQRLIAGSERRIDARELTGSQQTDLALCYHIAFENMLKGGGEEDWYVLAGSLNVALVLAEQGYGEEFIPEIKSAMESLMSVKYRADRIGRWAFDGDGIQHMRIALEVHDQQCALAKRSEIKKALKMITERANAGHMYAFEQCELEAA